MWRQGRRLETQPCSGALEKVWVVASCVCVCVQDNAQEGPRGQRGWGGRQRPAMWQHCSMKKGTTASVVVDGATPKPKSSTLEKYFMFLKTKTYFPYWGFLQDSLKIYILKEILYNVFVLRFKSSLKNCKTHLKTKKKKKHAAKPDKTIKKIRRSDEIWHQTPATGQQIDHNSFYNRCIKSHRQSTVTV